MSLELIDVYEVVACPEYKAELDDFRDDVTGEQMCLMHIEFDIVKFSPQVMKRLLEHWHTFRDVTDAPLYGIQPEPDDEKWEHFVSLLGFQDTHSKVHCTDGQSRRLFVSLPHKDFDNGERKQRDQARQHD